MYKKMIYVCIKCKSVNVNNENKQNRKKLFKIFFVSFFQTKSTIVK